jgi:hypothetical protein
MISADVQGFAPGSGGADCGPAPPISHVKARETVNHNAQRGIAVEVAANAGGSTVMWSGEFVASLASSVIDIGWCEVIQDLMVALVVVCLDEGTHCVSRSPGK